jgi:hypothetical protein
MRDEQPPPTPSSEAAEVNGSSALPPSDPLFGVPEYEWAFANSCKPPSML